MTETPLSDAMTAHADAGTPDTYDRFVALFRGSVIGIVAVGAVSHDAYGNPVAGGDLRAASTTHGDGTERILCFADPDVASRAPGTPMNAGIPGHVLLSMAAGDPDCDGLLVNCATREVSLVISKETAGRQPG